MKKLSVFGGCQQVQIFGNSSVWQNAVGLHSHGPTLVGTPRRQYLWVEPYIDKQSCHHLLDCSHTSSGRRLHMR